MQAILCCLEAEGDETLVSTRSRHLPLDALDLNAHILYQDQAGDRVEIRQRLGNGIDVSFPTAREIFASKEALFDRQEGGIG